MKTITCYKDLQSLSEDERKAFIDGVHERYAKRNPELQSKGIKKNDDANDFLTILCNRREKPIAAYFSSDYQKFILEDEDPEYARNYACDFRHIIVNGTKIKSLI
jgi:hypothetical protein